MFFIRSDTSRPGKPHMQRRPSRSVDRAGSRRRRAMNDAVAAAERTGARPTSTSVDPATATPGKSYEGHTAAEAVAIARDAHAAFQSWRRTSFAERAELMAKAGAVLRRRKDEFAALMTREMGKTLSEGRAEIEKCAGNCDFYAERAEAFLSPEPVAFDGADAKVVFRPLGTVLAVMPWNFPFWQVFRFAAPTLMAGNTAVL